MSQKSSLLCIVIFLIVLLTADAAAETLPQKEPLFVVVHLPHGISLEVPRTWRMIVGDAKDPLEIPAPEDVDLSRMRLPDNAPLFRATATPTDRPASVSVAFFSQATLTLQQAEEMPPDALAAYDRELRRSVEGAFKGQGVDLLTWNGTRRDQLNDRLALVSEYRRQSHGFPPTWEQINTIPLERGMIVLTVTHSEHAESFWRSVVQRIRDSCRVKNESLP
jgi:hypothetical protein